MSDSEFSINRQLDVICDGFENQWQADERSDIKSFLEQIASEQRDQLLPMLLEIDVELRQKANQEVSAADYAQLGEQAVLHVDGLLATAGNDATIPPSDSPDSHRTTPAAVTPSPPATSNQIGPYKLLRQIGEGGMGTVWMAEQREPVKRRVALKLIRADIGSKESIARFEAERQALAMMDHQNIARVLDAGTAESGSPYFVMELVKGVPLNEYCDNNKLSVPARLGLMVDVCKAIQHAHQKGIIHRDLKPSNVLATESDGKAIPKVIDFGLAKALEHTHRLTDKTLFTEFGKVVGTLQYMSPEQAEMDSLDIDTRTDIYSLGVMLYELLTGSTPLDKETLGRNALLQVLALIREKEPQRPSNRLSSSTNNIDSISEHRKITPSKLQQILRGDLDWVVMKALEKDRDRRYESANGFADDIERYLKDEAVEARPPSTGYRVSKFVKKNRGLVATTATVLTLLIAGIAGTTWGLQWALKERSVAQAKTIEVTKEKERADEKEKLATQNEKRAEEEAKNARQAQAAAIKSQKETEQLAETNRQQLVASQLAQADQVVNDDPGAALPHFLEALRLDSGHAEQERLHRIRAASAFGRLPKFTQFWRHSAAVNHVAFDAAANRVATSSHDKTVEIRQLESGDLVCPPLQHKLPVFASAFSPDSTMLATVSSTHKSGTLNLWNVESGQQIGNPVTMLPMLQVFWTPKGRVGIITVNVTGGASVILFDPKSRQSLGMVVLPSYAGGERPSEEKIHEPTGRLIQNRGPKIRVLDMDNGFDVLAEMEHPEPVVYATFNNDGSRVVTATNSQMFVWDAVSGEKLTETAKDSLRYGLIVPNRNMRSGFSFDSRQIIVGLDSEKSFVLELDGTVSHSALIPIDDTKERTPAPNGRWIAFADSIGTVRLWDIFGERFVSAPMRHSGAVNWMKFTPDCRRLLTACTDGTVRVWDLAATSDIEYKGFRHSSGPITTAKLSHDESKLMSAGYRWSRLHDIKTGSSVYIQYDGRISLDFNNDGIAAFGTNNHEARVLDLWTGKYLSKSFRHDRKFVHKVALSSNGKLLATIAATGFRTGGLHDLMGEAFIYDVESGKVVAGPLSFRKKQSGFLSKLKSLTAGMDVSGVQSIQISPDNRLAVYGGGQLETDGSVPRLRIIDLASGKVTEFDYGHGNDLLFVKLVAFSSSGRFLLSGSGSPYKSGRGGELRVWNVETKSMILGPLSFTGRISSAVFSEDERLLAISADQYVHVYEVLTGKKICPPLLHPDSVSMLSLSPDGKLAATSTSAHDVHVWDLGQGRMLAPPIPHAFPVEEVTMLTNNRVMVCSHHDVKIWKYKPEQSTLDDMRQVSRLLTSQMLSPVGIVQVSAKELAADWQAVREKDPKLLAASRVQVLDWYAKLQRRFVVEERAWSAAAFHREYRLQMDPDDINVLRELAGNYCENGQFREALQFIARIVDKNPEDVGGRYYWATALLAAGEREQFQKQCNVFVATHKDTTEKNTVVKLVKILMLGEADLEDSELPTRLTDKFLENEPNDAGLLIAKALVALRAKRFADCVRVCNKIDDVTKKARMQRAPAFAIRSLAKKQLGDEEGATADRKTASEMREYLNDHNHGIWADLAHIDHLLAEGAEQNGASNTEKVEK